MTPLDAKTREEGRKRLKAEYTGGVYDCAGLNGWLRDHARALLADSEGCEEIKRDLGISQGFLAGSRSCNTSLNDEKVRLEKVVFDFEAERDALKAENEGLRKALELAAVRLEILTGRARACHEETGRHGMLAEAEAFCEEACLALGHETRKD